MPACHCPQCDAQVDPAAKYCWLCNATLSSPSAGAAPLSPFRAQLGDSSSRPLQYGISSLLLVITFVAILCSIIKMNPGLGIVIAILTLPAMIRTVLVAFRQRESGKPMSAAGKTGVFFLTMAMSLCVVVASCAAFCFTFFFTCLAAASVKGGGMRDDLLTVPLIVGGIAAVGVAVLITFVFRAALRRGRNR
jgi:hypothetical protein